MWFSFTRKNRRKQATKSRPNTFRPQIDALEDRCLMSAGGLDPTFGSGGIVAGSIGNSQATPVVVQPADGKIVAGGYAFNGSVDVFTLTRYNPNGSVDPTFGTNGTVETVVGSSHSWINGLAIQGDGKIVAVGSASITIASGKKTTKTDDAFAVARYNSNGTLDTTFGGTGIVLTDIGPSSAPMVGAKFGAGAHAVAIDGSGNIDVAGTANPAGATSQYDQVAIFRYKANGSFDTTFGPSHNGMVITPQFDNQANEATALVFQPNGQIVLAGYTGDHANPTGIDILRYTAAGQLDASFGTAGIVKHVSPSGTNAAALSVLVQNSGSIVAAGYSVAGTSITMTLAGFTNAGQLDPTFGNSGFAITPTLRKGALIVQGPNGDLLVAADTQATNTGFTDFGVAAFLPKGAPDTTFGTAGTTTVDFRGYQDRALSLAIQSDGKIVAAGFACGNNPQSIFQGTFALARFLPPDTKVTSFTATPNPVTAGSSVTLSAANILNANPSSTITQVAFYLDANGDGILEPTGDTLLGYGTNVNGVWSFTFIPTTSGTFNLFALATDSNGVLSDPVALTLTVI